mgnify:CR=1 FL=1
MDCAVLFADVAGSTALYEVLGDQRAFMLVESCLATMTACTQELHGRVVKTIGDAVMAFWGAPLDDPQHAEPAVTAAISMQQAMQVLVADLLQLAQLEGSPRPTADRW